MSDKNLREAVEALRLDLNADRDYLVSKGSIGHRLHALLAAHPPEPSSDVTEDAAYWRDRFYRMRAMYRERFNEGLSTEDWHRKRCGLMNAQPVTEDELAVALYEDPELGRGYLRHVACAHLARRILAHFHVTRRGAQ